MRKKIWLLAGTAFFVFAGCRTAAYKDISHARLAGEKLKNMELKLGNKAAVGEAVPPPEAAGKMTKAAMRGGVCLEAAEDARRIIAAEVFGEWQATKEYENISGGELALRESCAKHFIASLEGKKKFQCARDGACAALVVLPRSLHEELQEYLGKGLIGGYILEKQLTACLPPPVD